MRGTWAANADDGASASSYFVFEFFFFGRLADYYWCAQRFDREVGEVLAKLGEIGELDSSIVVVSGDNGMPFPRSNATLYDLKSDPDQLRNIAGDRRHGVTLAHYREMLAAELLASRDPRSETGVPVSA